MNKEILSVVELVSYEKYLPREKIFEVLETALSIVTKKRHPQEIDVRVNIDRKSGNFHTLRRWKIVNKVRFPTKQITFEAAKFENQEAKLNDFIEYQIKSIPFDRSTIQVAKKIIIKKVKVVERRIMIEKFYQNKGKMVKGIVKSINRNYIVLDVDNDVEAIIMCEHLLTKDKFNIGDQIKGVLYKLYTKSKIITLYISRSHPEMLLELFYIEVPEIRENLVEIKSVARDPGVRSKIAVFSYDSTVDPIGSCIGMKGFRVQAVSQELCGERIDIILWDKNPIHFIMNTMSPIEVVSILIHKAKRAIDISVDAKYLAQTIGKNGQNVRLSSILVNWDLNIMTTNDLYSTNKRKIYKIINAFNMYFNIKKSMVYALIRSGISSLKDLVCIPYSELLKIKEMNQYAAYKIQNIANEILSNLLISKKIYTKDEKYTLLSLYGMNQDLLFQLYKKNIFTLETLSNQTVYDLIDIHELNIKKAGALIIEARNMCWFNGKF